PPALQIPSRSSLSLVLAVVSRFSFVSHHFFSFFFFNDTATTEIYTLSLHDALPISVHRGDPDRVAVQPRRRGVPGRGRQLPRVTDRKSTRLNSSHVKISYAVFCLKKKKKKNKINPPIPNYCP